MASSVAQAVIRRDRIVVSTGLMAVAAVAAIYTVDMTLKLNQPMEVSPSGYPWAQRLLVAIRHVDCDADRIDESHCCTNGIDAYQDRAKSPSRATSLFGHWAFFLGLCDHLGCLQPTVREPTSEITGKGVVDSRDDQHCSLVEQQYTGGSRIFPVFKVETSMPKPVPVAG